MGRLTEVYRQYYFDSETECEYLVHGCIEDGFSVYLQGKMVEPELEDRILHNTVFQSELWADERKRRARAVQRLKERLSSDPWYKDKSESYWINLQASAALAD